MKLAKTYNFVKKDLNIIEKSLKNTIQADHIVLQDASTQLLEAGGKRIRPVFVLLSGQMGSYHIDRFKTVAVALELIHMATLVHDDVVDNSELRRGKPTVKHSYGNRVAMYTGNYILALAIESITKIKDPNIHQLLSNTLVEVCLGEVEQIEFKYNWDQQLRHYLRRIKRKTALLIATSCKLGAMAGMTTPEEANRLYQYGYYIGMSYQIIDDILDFTSTEKELGKPIASDLLQGNLTLPVLYAMKDQAFNDLLRDTFAHPDEVDPVHFEKLLFMLKKSDAIEKSYQLSELYLNKALEVLKPLPDLEAKQILQEIAQSIGDRRS
ncbi:MAG TPA: heptaprenyl diphosphate synthase component II [Candidatus Dormibacteraeota bacterium]|nr:heptaprenyl diphosphate synthase component II [Candidatus Dormibacteraeota bacterium]